MFKAQGFMAGLQAGGSLVGIVVGGVVYEYCGGRTLFRSMAVIMVSFQFREILFQKRFVDSDYTLKASYLTNFYNSCLMCVL